MRNGGHFFPTSDTCHSPDAADRPGRVFKDWKVRPPYPSGFEVSLLLTWATLKSDAVFGIPAFIEVRLFLAFFP